MANIDINKLSKKDLESLIQKSKRQLKRIETEEKRPSLKSSDERVVAIANQVRQLADELKLPKKEALKAVAGNLRISVDGAKSASSANVKYRHPDDPQKTWAGTGARPKWLKDELEKGRHLEDFRV